MQANTDNDLTEDTTRHYRVSAINYAGMGPVSAPAMAKTSATGAPVAPTGLTVMANGQTEIVLGWGDVTGATGYKVEWSVDGAIPWMVLVENTEGSGALNAGTQAVESRYTDTGLTAGTTRHYRVSGINIYGAGPVSVYLENDHQATTASALAPGAPTGLTVMADGETKIELLWSSPADPGATPITGYKIEWSADGNLPWMMLVADTEATGGQNVDTSGVQTYYIDDPAVTGAALAAGTTRHYRVSAINSEGTGPSSESAMATTASMPSLGAPTGLMATVNGETDIELSWGEVTGADSYKIEWSSNDKLPWTVLVADTGNDDNTYTDTGLTAGTKRYYRVSTINFAGTGEASGSEMATTSSGSTPGAPVGLTATANGQTMIELSWTAPQTNAESIEGYKIEWSSNGKLPWMMLVADTEDTGAQNVDTEDTSGVQTYYIDRPDVQANTVNDLTEDTTRHYRVSAINYAGMGPVSAPAMAKTSAMGAPGAPAVLMVTANGQTEIVLGWDDVTGATGYKVEWSVDGAIPWMVLVETPRVQEP